MTQLQWQQDIKSPEGIPVPGPAASAAVMIQESSDLQSRIEIQSGSNQHICLAFETLHSFERLLPGRQSRHQRTTAETTFLRVSCYLLLPVAFASFVGCVLLF